MYLPIFDAASSSPLSEALRVLRSWCRQRSPSPRVIAKGGCGYSSVPSSLLHLLLLHLQLPSDSPSSSSSSPKVSSSSPSVSSYTKGMPLVGTEPWTFWTKAFDGVSPPSLPLFPLSNFYCVILEVLFSLGEVTSCILNSFV